MTTVPATTSSTSSTNTTASATAAAAVKQNAVDYNSFLQLMVQELKNQDPTSPSDPTQYLSQIAMFSNVQQATQTNASLASILTASTLTQAESLIGKVVTSGDGTQSGQVASVALGASGAATATLADGSTMTLDNTITISAALGASS